MPARTAKSTAAEKTTGGKPKKYDYEPKEQYLAFGAALKRHRQGSGFPTQARLGAALDVSWHAVGSWEKGIWAPAPEKVFEIERLLDLPPGTLSRHLGYLPLGAQPSVQAAVDSDPRLDERGKTLLIDMYRTLARPQRRSSRSASA